MNIKRSFLKQLSFIIVVFFTITSCNNKPTETPKPKGPMMARAEAYIVKTSSVIDKIDVPGTLLPYETTEIHPEVAGKIVQLNIRDGQMVTKGSLLVKLFDGDLQAQLHKLAVQLQIAEKTQQRSDALLKINAISQQDYDLAVLQVSTTKADMQIIRANIQKTEIRAPFSGKIGFKNVSAGAYVSPTTVICTLDIINQLKLEFSVPEKYNARVAIGQPVTFIIENSPHTYTAKVIATEAGITENTRSLKVRAVVENIDKFVSPGVFAKVKFDMGTDNNAILIPAQAILPGARDKKVIIYRDSMATFQVVTTGIRDSSNVQVLSGLKVGDTILTSGLLSVKQGSKVMISKIKS